MQNAFTLGYRQFIIRTGKVVHADKLISRGRQRNNRLLKNVQLLFCRRQIGVFDFALRSKERWQMRIVEYAQTIGVELRHFL